jgi:hypothetical protein
MAKGWLRFCHLQQRNVVKSWAQLDRMQRLYGFPKGRMISPNVRAWTEEEIDAYYASCPVEGPEPRGVAAKKHRDRLHKSGEPTQTDEGRGTSLIDRPQPRGAGKTPSRGPPRKRKALDSTDASAPT